MATPFARGDDVGCGRTTAGPPRLKKACTRNFLSVNPLLETLLPATMGGATQEDDMPLRRLCKSGSSARDEDCPALYVDEDDPDVMVGQGPVLDAVRLGELQHCAPEETGVRIPTETVLRAAGLFLAERGRPAVLAEVLAYLSEGGAR